MPPAKTLPPGPPARALRPHSTFAPEPVPEPPAYLSEPDHGPPDGPDEAGRRPLGIHAYCWPCGALRLFERPVRGVPRRCVQCRMPEGHGRPTTCAICDAELPRNPEAFDRDGQRRRLCCTWRCLVLLRVRQLGSSDVEAREIACRMGWLT